MLVLSRKRNQSITIGPDIKITVVRFQHKPDVVHLGIEAPPAIPVHREEVAAAIARAEAHVDAGTIGLGGEQGDAAENQGADDTGRAWREGQPENPPQAEGEDWMDAADNYGGRLA